jgi:hypothetical protein
MGSRGYRNARRHQSGTARTITTSSTGYFGGAGAGFGVIKTLNPGRKYTLLGGFLLLALASDAWLDCMDIKPTIATPKQAIRLARKFILTSYQMISLNGDDASQKDRTVKLIRIAMKGSASL